jgi:hypothetical protein
VLNLKLNFNVRFKKKKKDTERADELGPECPVRLRALRPRRRPEHVSSANANKSPAEDESTVFKKNDQLLLNL